MYKIFVNGVKHIIATSNWEDYRVYLYWKIPQQDGSVKTIELGFLNTENELEDDLELRGVRDEIVDFIEENRERIIEEADY